MADKLETISKEDWYKSKKKKIIKKEKHNVTKILLLFIVLVGIFGMILMNYSNISMQINRIKAIKYSEKEVEKHLSSPSTAKFPSFIFDSEDCKAKLHSEDDESTTWVVGGYVDSQNYMGAMVRKTWVIGIKVLKNGNQYELLDIDLK